MDEPLDKQRDPLEGEQSRSDDARNANDNVAANSQLIQPIQPKPGTSTLNLPRTIEATQQTSVHTSGSQSQGTPSENDIVKPMKLSDKLMIAFTAVIAFTGIVGAIIFYYQLDAMRGQLKEMRSGSGDTHDLAVAAGRQAIAAGTQADRTKDLADRMKDQADRTKTIADQAVVQAKAAGVGAQAASSAAKTASDQLVLAERPWVKIKHRIVSPLTFNVMRNAGPVAIMSLEDTIENVGQTVALNLLSWEDVIPVDLDNSTRTARRRQAEYCDANRHPDPRGLTGYTLFPHDPLVQDSVVGPTMATVEQFTIHTNDQSRIDGTVAFVLVGCVFYRSSFEPTSNPTHQTRFMYYLGTPEDVGFLPNVLPRGIANTLRLIMLPEGLTAD